MATPALSPMAAPEEEINPHFPMTLDLRLPPPRARPKSKRRGLCHDCGPLSNAASLWGCLRRVIGRWSKSPAALGAHHEGLPGNRPRGVGTALGARERRIRENGITYNIYSDPLGANRPWQIDIVPFLIPADEWRHLEAGIIQRARLLSRILEDLYGPQELLANGHFPAALLFANPAFLRPLVGVPVPAHSYLHMLAVDLARSPDGQWWVLSDRTQAPSGSGYALENRTIVSDVLPDIFRRSNVLRLAPFFRAQRDALATLAKRSNPRIVLLTPGPLNETYFEHSYIARYLGFTLCAGADLTVRDRASISRPLMGWSKWM